MVDPSRIEEHAEVIGADGVHVGTVDKEGDRIKLTKQTSDDGRHHYVSIGYMHELEDGKVRLGVNGDFAVSFEDE